MEKILALALPLLLLFGCIAEPAGDGSGNEKLPKNGTALVKVQMVTSGCGIPPLDGNLSACGERNPVPAKGKFSISVYSLSRVPPNNATYVITVYNEETTRTAGPVLEKEVETDSDGEFSLELPPGDYGFMIYNEQGSGHASERFAIQSGKTTMLATNFSILVP